MMPLTWQDVAARLARARNYWLHTTSPAGLPQVTPVWGAVVDDHLYHYSLRSTVKARNLRQNEGVAVHLESGADVVIVYGTLADVGRPVDAATIVQAFAAKYDQPQEQPFLPGANPRLRRPLPAQTAARPGLVPSRLRGIDAPVGRRVVTAGGMAGRRGRSAARRSSSYMAAMSASPYRACSPLGFGNNQSCAWLSRSGCGPTDAPGRPKAVR